ATASMPMSMPNATNAIRPTRQTVTSGRTAPGRRAICNGIRIGRLSSDDGVWGCVSVGFAAHEDDNGERHVRIHPEEGGNHRLVGPRNPDGDLLVEPSGGPGRLAGRVQVLWSGIQVGIRHGVPVDGVT